MKPIREMLLKMREELVREIARRSRETAVSGVSDIGDILDSVSEERTRELDMILTDREKQKLKQIDDALDRIEENTYGLCEECGVKIPRARLKVVPFAKHCVECKEAIEREERYTREEPEEAVKKVPMAEAEE
ncbi:MAG: TraR/DksA family transcriptional regulator [Thermodesulfobacteriota bacterium]|jgi:DnaK suppressor protein|nr:TraR/DksA family transcriptional regulator [Thermodesulfobacteriota bacterium]HSQ54032.1 TraR/DksA family transcriptional regulator [Candidatus Bathyarchaeia archaeon]